MAKVSEVTLRYAAKGAKRAEKADKQVRQSIKRTAKTARKESSTIGQWMQRHKTAIAAIGAATAGIMFQIIRNSPALNAQLAQMRLGFSLLAMVIGNDVAPATQGLSDAVLDLVSAYQDLDPAIRKPTSAFAALISVVTLAGIALAGLQSIIAGTAIGSALATAASLAAGAIGALLGLLSGPVIVVILLVAAAASILFLAWQNNWLGIRNIVFGVITFIIELFTAFVKWITPFWNKLTSAILAGRWGDAWDTIKSIADSAFSILKGWFEELGEWILSKWEEIKAGLLLIWENIKSGIEERVSKLVQSVKDLVSDIEDKIIGLIDSARQWGRDLMSQFASGIISKAKAVRSRVQSIVGSIKSKLSFDIQSNDRMARRWGKDLIGEFSKGIEQNASRLDSALPGSSAIRPQPAPAGGGGGNTNVTVIMERGAVQMRGAGSQGIDTDRMVEEVGDDLAKRFYRRG